MSSRHTMTLGRAARVVTVGLALAAAPACERDPAAGVGPTYTYAPDADQGGAVDRDDDREDPVIGRGDPSPDPGDPGTGLGVARAETKLEQLLLEMADQLDAGNWAPYLALRAEVAAGLYVPALREALEAPAHPAQPVAAVILEDLLVAAVPPAGLDVDTHATLRQLAAPILAAALADPDPAHVVSAVRPLAARILGRLPRGATQALLFERLDAETDPTLRLVVLAALGDNANDSGAAVLQARFADLTDCADARMAAASLRRTHDAVDAIDLRPWLGEVAAPRLVACAGLSILAGGAPDADLLALTLAFDRPAHHTLVDAVLLAPPSQVSDDLRRHALRLLRTAPDPGAAAVLGAALPALGTGDLAAEAAAVLAILEALLDP